MTSRTAEICALLHDSHKSLTTTEIAEATGLDPIYVASALDVLSRTGIVADGWSYIGYTEDRFVKEALQEAVGADSGKMVNAKAVARVYRKRTGRKNVSTICIYTRLQGMTGKGGVVCYRTESETYWGVRT